MVNAKRLIAAAALVVAIGGCGRSPADEVIAQTARTGPVAQTTIAGPVDETTIDGCPTTTTLNDGQNDDPWRGTAPPHIPRGNGDLPVAPAPTLPARDAALAGEVVAGDTRIGPIVAEAELLRAVPWNTYLPDAWPATRSVGALLYYRLSEPTDVPLPWGRPVSLGGESGWQLDADGLPVLEPAVPSVAASAAVVGVYVLGSQGVYLVMAHNHVPLAACGS